MTTSFNQRLGLVAALTILWVASPAAAADVRFEVSAQETYVGMPVTLSVVVENATEHTPPSAPSVEGAVVRSMGAPSRSSSTSIINGRVSRESSLTYAFRIAPGSVGSLRIPAMEVVADGTTFRSEPIDIVVNAVQSGGELLVVEVEADRTSIYLGQPLGLKLNVYIRPFVDESLQVRLDEGDMWGLIDDEVSRWGPFAERMTELAQSRRRPAGREKLREGPDGRRLAYFHYELSTRFWPDRTGALDLSDLVVGMAYPETLERDRRIFGFRDLRVATAKPVVARAESPDVVVEPLPDAGRPDHFTGAVGAFEIDVDAVPLEVAVGQPITLTIRVRERELGGIRLDMLRPPDLHAVDELTASFRVPDEPLAGVVEGRTKRFTQSIRATGDSVARIPAIPFSFFDPDRAEYRTAWSDPIPIDVRPTASVAMSDVVGGAAPADDGSAELTEVAGGLLANYLEPQRVLRDQRVVSGAWLVILLAGPPVVVGVVHLGVRRKRRLVHDTGYARQRRARRRALAQIADAAAADRGDRAALIGEALGGYVADRCNLPAGAVTRADVDEALRGGGIDPALRGDVDRLLAACEAARYAGLEGTANGDVTRDAHAIIERLERQRL